MGVLYFSTLAGAIATSWVSMNVIRYRRSLRTAAWVVSIAAFILVIATRNAIPDVFGVLYLYGFVAGTAAAVWDVYHTFKALSEPYLPAVNHHPEND